MLSKYLNIIILLLTFQVFGQFKGHLQDYNLKAKVKEVREQLDSKDNLDVVFDEKGHKKRVVYYHKNRKRYSKTKRYNNNLYKEFKYKDNKIKQEFWKEEDSGEIIFNYVYSRDRLIEKKSIGIKSHIDKIIYTHDTKGRIVTETGLLKPRKIQWIWLNRYDKKSNLINRMKVNKKRRIEADYIYKYDDNNRLIEKIVYRKFYSPNYHGTVYVYNENNDVIKEYHYQMTMNLKLLKQGYWRKFDYTYDEHNNWIKRITYQNYQYLHTINRTITYYDQ